MGSRGIQIVGMDVKELVLILNKALSDEWLAHYQYWVGSKVVAGPMKDAVIAELVQHATEEMAHAELLTTRIIQLGGTPVLTPAKWFDLTNCAYDAPADPFVQVVLEQNIKGEQCAISVYDKLMKLTKDADPVTYNIALQIIEQEVEHEEDLQSLLEDLNLMLQRYGGKK
ncbi:MAG TPA: ferritin-like domain-containing protein [Kiritimatiellia bacterium]|nr:ferritin-like domain-containing protein [Kiritimatiellia bacterium]HPA77835.1 ferritin-like domain-containing protein [Kiritimatiellia bacterium]HQQ04492.1 ferritin-like domain-containing protein [Kiritimatiellia bacterium]